MVTLLLLELLGGGVLTAAARGRGISAAWTSIFLVVTAALAFLAALALNDALRDRSSGRSPLADAGRDRGAAVRGFRADEASGGATAEPGLMSGGAPTAPPSATRDEDQRAV